MPPANEQPVAVQTIVDVPALNVRFVLVVKSTAFAPVLKVTVEEPKLIVLPLEPEEERVKAVTL